MGTIQSATTLVVTAVSTEKPERLEGTITVQTDDDYQPTIAIPFCGLISG